MPAIPSRHKRKTSEQPKYSAPKAIYIDVDGTLLVRGKPNGPLIDWARQKYNEGYEINVWSSRGAANARLAVGAAGLFDIVSNMLSKPGYIVDDRGFTWTKYVNQVKGFT